MTTNNNGCEPTVRTSVDTQTQHTLTMPTTTTTVCIMSIFTLGIYTYKSNKTTRLGRTQTSRIIHV